MADTAILRPTSDAAGSAFTHGQGVWTRAGGRVAGSTFAGCDEASLDETDTGYAVARTTDTSYNPGRYEFYFSAPPTGVAITSLTIKAYCRYSCAGPDFFAEYPRMKGFVSIGGTRYYQSGPGYVTVTNFCNRNTTSDPGTHGLYTVGVWATNPATAAAWTLSDLAAGSFIAGLEAGGVAEGQAGNGIPHANGGATAQFDLGEIWIELTTTPSETFVNPIRLSASAVLRIFGGPTRPVELAGPVELSILRPGDTLYVAHPLYPSEDGLGAGTKDWELRPLKVLSVADPIEPPQIRIRALDLRDRFCSFWSTWRTDIGADTVNLSGIPRFDQGGGYSVARSSADWIERPTDRALVAISAAKPRITPFGLLVQGGAFSGSSAATGELVSYFKNNSFSQGAGGHGTSVPNGDTTAFTSWGAVLVGGGHINVWKDANYRFDDPTTYARHVKMGSGAAYVSDNGHLYQTVTSHGANYRIRAQLVFAAQQPTLNPGLVSFTLRRTIGGVSNDWSASGWNATLGWKQMFDGQTASANAFGRTSFRKYGSFFEYWTEEIDFGGSIGDLRLYACLVLQNNAGIYLHQAKLYHSNLATGQAQRVIRRVYDVTQGSNVTNAADVVDLNNDASYRIALTDRGTVSFVFTPLWDHEDMEDSAFKYLLCLVHDSTNNDRDQLYYRRLTATTGRYYLERIYGGASVGLAYVDVSSSPEGRPRYMTPVKLSMRWTGAAGELGLAARTLDVFKDGAKGTSAVASQYCRQKAVGAYVTVGRGGFTGPGSCEPPYTFADGYVADMEFRTDVLSDVRVAALHNRIGLNLPLPSVAA